MAKGDKLVSQLESEGLWRPFHAERKVLQLAGTPMLPILLSNFLVIQTSQLTLTIPDAASNVTLNLLQAQKLKLLTKNGIGIELQGLSYLVEITGIDTGSKLYYVWCPFILGLSQNNLHLGQNTGWSAAVWSFGWKK